MKFKTAIIATLQLLITFLILSLSACSTPYKKYSPPDSTKLRAAVTKLHTAIDKSHTTSRKIAAKHVEAQQTTDSIKVEQFNLDQKLDELMKQAPPELQGKVKEAQNLSSAQSNRIELLEKQLKDGSVLQTELDKDNSNVTAAEGDVKRNGEQYMTDAQTLADKATEERELRRKAEAENLKMKIFKWLGGGAVILFIGILIAGFFLWKAGKLTLWGAKKYVGLS